MKCFLLCLMAALFLGGHLAMAAEEPAHTVVLHEGSFELRDYPARVVAQVHVNGTQFQAGGSGFRLLAAYIFGGNASQQHIAMTAPVSQFQTGPNRSPQPDKESWTVQFFMPNSAVLAQLPPPADPRVTLASLPPQRLAVLRYSGWSTAAGFVRNSAALLAACTAHHLRPAGPVMLAQYDPPWTLGFLRRNEAMVAVVQ